MAPCHLTATNLGHLGEDAYAQDGATALTIEEYLWVRVPGGSWRLTHAEARQWIAALGAGLREHGPEEPHIVLRDDSPHRDGGKTVMLPEGRG